MEAGRNRPRKCAGETVYEIGMRSIRGVSTKNRSVVLLDYVVGGAREAES
jgi:hypothetical protein